MNIALAVSLIIVSLIALRKVYQVSFRIIDKTDPVNTQVVLDIKQAMIRDQIRRNK